MNTLNFSLSLAAYLILNTIALAIQLLISDESALEEMKN